MHRNLLRTPRDKGSIGSCQGEILLSCGVYLSRLQKGIPESESGVVLVLLLIGCVM